MKKRTLFTVILAALLLAVGIASTVAWLVASSNTLENTFTVGKVEITLTETTGGEYMLSPGVSLKKDPTVTVKAGSDACWVFVKIVGTSDLSDLCSYEIADGWLPLENKRGVYYRRIEGTEYDTSYSVLKDDLITVRDTLTEQQLNAITEKPYLTFYAYAVQLDVVKDVEEGWHILNS